MAIDTENKRRSVQAYTIGAMRPRPDAAVDAGDRATVAWMYSGLFSGGAPPVVVVSEWITRARRRGRR